MSRILIFLITSYAAIFSLMSQANEKHIYGLHEAIYIAELGANLKAKLDTGAQTASISARSIEYFTRDDQRWVRFQLAVDKAPESFFELPLARVSKIKRRASDYDPEEEKGYTKRPVVKVTLALGDQQKTIEANLTDRSSFEFPVLLGSNALKRFNALVDPGAEYLAGKPELDTTNTNSTKTE